MASYRLTLLFSVAALGMAVVSSPRETMAGASAASFSGLRAGDVVDMKFRSSGCFRQLSYEVKVTGGAAPTAEVDELVPDFDSTPRKDQRKKLGKLKLSRADLKGLDELLAFYRSRPKGGCTTVEYLELSLNGGSTEKYTDGSCSFGRRGMLRITELARRLGKD